MATDRILEKIHDETTEIEDTYIGPAACLQFAILVKSYYSVMIQDCGWAIISKVIGDAMN